jgi:CDP-paratose 2-epimerase
MRTLVTGSSGLIGSAMVRHFAPLGEVVGIDNDSRRDFFGREASTDWNKAEGTFPIDIRERDKVRAHMAAFGPYDLIVHCAAQPSHDLSAKRPLDDFDTNALGTINLLEATRLHSPEATFVFMSTSKVYGDTPNRLPIEEFATRYDAPAVSETMSIDTSLHSPFGASKVAADVMTQEYGRYFGLKTTCLRGACLTGPGHSAVELHGFLSYLVKCQLSGETYKVFGYKGKQVRDNIHSYDVARAVEEIHKNPRRGEVYNLGGGRPNAISILEAFVHVEALSGKKARSEYVPEARKGDHIVYISDISKFRRDYPDWKVTKSLDDMLVDIIRGWQRRLAA